MFAKTFGCCRKVWNLMLSDKNAFYRETGKLLYNTPQHIRRNTPISGKWTALPWRMCS